jgi:sugar lactone lactonase YvrE/dienelactone hydrolase
MLNRLLAIVVSPLLVLAAESVSAADSIVRSPKLPETTPWDLAKLSEPPAVEWLDKESPVRSLLYAGEPYTGRPTQVFAYYATPGTLAGKPDGEKKLPAVVLVHGGGGTAFKEWAELWAGRGYAAIAMDLAGHKPIEGKNAHDRGNRTPLTTGGPGQGDEEKFGSVAKAPTEQWPYHAVASVVLAHSLVRSFPEVDPSRTAVTGISWGGYLTCIVAGVDSRFRAAVPVYGCGYLHENSAWLDRFAKMTAADRERWISLWDPSRYLPAVSMPILFVNGTNDFAYPLDSYLKSYDAVPGIKQIRVTVNMPHGHPPGWAPPEIGLFIDQHLNDGTPLPDPSEPRVRGGQLRFNCVSPARLKQAELHYTTETGPINQRAWQTKNGSIEGSEISAALPPDEATAWFLTVADERGAIVSTRVNFTAANARAAQAKAAEVPRPTGEKIVSPDAKLELLYTRTAPIQGGLTEGPAVAPDGSVYFSDIPFGASGGLIVRFDPKTKKTEIFTDNSGKSNGLQFDSQGRLLACEGANHGGRCLSRWDVATKKKTVLVDQFQDKRFNAPNDLCVDRAGRVYFTDPKYLGDELRELAHMAVYRLDPSGELHEATHEVAKPNGVAISPDGKTLYVADHDNASEDVTKPPPPKAGNMKIYAFPLAADGSVSGPRRTIVDFGEKKGCDGMCVDSQGHVYLTVRDPGRPGVMVVDPDGKEVAFIATGPPNQSGDKLVGLPSNVEFGIGDEASVLYVTIDLCLYRIPLKVRGFHAQYAGK